MEIIKDADGITINEEIIENNITTMTSEKVLTENIPTKLNELRNQKDYFVNQIAKFQAGLDKVNVLIDTINAAIAE